MNKIHFILKKALTPVTIMVVPHDSLRSLNVKIPSVLIFLCLVLSGVGGVYIFSLVANGLQYPSLVEKVEFYSRQFSQISSMASALKEDEITFRNIFSLKSKEKILETMDTSYSGSIDMQNLKQELQKAVETVDEIKDYLRTQKDVYLATPKGYPVLGHITSPYGRRSDPFRGEEAFHSGVDIASTPEAPVRATADGVVSHSGRTGNSGNVVVLEHSCGFSTIYAHNKRNVVKVGQRVKRGDVIGYVGSTGKSTGPHVHYEVWQKGRNVNPYKVLQGRS